MGHPARTEGGQWEGKGEDEQNRAQRHSEGDRLAQRGVEKVERSGMIMMMMFTIRPGITHRVVNREIEMAR